VTLGSTTAVVSQFVGLYATDRNHRLLSRELISNIISSSGK